MTEFHHLKADYDFDPFEGKARVYLIASTPRCGSTLLGHLLFATGNLGSPLEYFAERRFFEWGRSIGSREPTDILRELVRRRTSPTGWFGFKAHWKQFYFLSKYLKLIPGPLVLDRAIWIKRRNLLEQTISLTIAQQTGQWTFDLPARREPFFDLKVVKLNARRIRESNCNWETYFERSRIPLKTVFYENLVSDQEFVISDLSEFFGVARPNQPVRPATRRQANDDLAANWKERILSALGPEFFEETADDDPGVRYLDANTLSY